ncbi:recombinase family protein [Microcoleus sp. FACHB-831]|uniref:recombinase family protein n=1 Tax=Microcoleus sp. FACHB-831 TaxID=2692827 RepID=UPI001686C3EA|nr:recombinase family protein [Microcoleus sp. FACHB-831]MBD1922009.1 recombinase family protein [Microcoleus sp. FACHB-831]
MLFDSIWIAGPTRSGKTTRLVDRFCHLLQGRKRQRQAENGAIFPQAKNIEQRSRQAQEILVFAANDDNRRDLADRLAIASEGRYPVISKTPLGFFQDEVLLFWPLLIQKLNLRAQFPLRLRPETEQELATRFWSPQLEQGSLQQTGMSDYRLVRRLLDLLQLAALSGTPLEDVASILQEGQNHEAEESETQLDWELVGLVLGQWRQWCLERGLLTYGIICELYWRHLLPDAKYQQHLRSRYFAVLADDVDDYPAIARDLFDFFLDGGAVGAFTYNIDGAVRLGLNADPNYMAGLEWRCQVERLTARPLSSLGDTLGEQVVQMVNEPMFLEPLPDDRVQLVQSTSRAQLLRQTAEVIIEAVQSGQVQPQEIAIIAPGLDAIARYTLVDILADKGIPVESLNDQRPLISSPTIRALLTLVALVYPGLGRLADRDAIAEMLVVLSSQRDWRLAAGDWEMLSSNSEAAIPDSQSPAIDPVRAGLLADYCYAPDPEMPRLLPPTAFPRWDRLGHRATAAYEDILQWLEVQRQQQEQRLIPSCVALLDRAIQKFLWNGSNLPYDQIAALRELMETAQHYWEIDGRLRQSNRSQPESGSEDNPAHTTIGRFIQLLRRGTVTANPYPVRPIGPSSRAVTLATIFQYRASRRFHRWQFWLDAGSPLWSKGGAATLFGANLFLKEWSGRPWTEEDIAIADKERLERILRDLLGRVGERVYLCHSDLATNGQEQTGPLLSLVNTTVPLVADAVKI